MIIVFGTPRSGTTFFTRWLSNNNTDYNYLGEYFQPYYFNTENIDTETYTRISKLSNNSLFKVHAGSELHPKVLSIVKSNPVNVVIRKNKLAQIISMGLASISDTWVTYDNNDTYVKGIYKKEWFDDITNRIEMFEKIYPSLNIKKKFFYEDIPLYQKNGKLPVKQNKYSIEDSLNLFLNKQEVLEWYNDWIRK
jgi:hypothetical protein